MTGRLALGGILAALLAAPAIAQDGDTLERLDERVEDADPLATSLRELRLDLREPSDFEHVYRAPGRDDLLMRVDGGLYAVFSMSRYLDTGFGAIPLIPTDTIFFIGRPAPRDMDALAPLRPIAMTSLPEPLPGGAVRAPRIDPALLDLRRSTRVTNRVESRVQDGVDPRADPRDEPRTEATARPVPRSGPAAPVDGGPAILTDAAYRSSRLHALMRRAAAAASSGP